MWAWWLVTTVLVLAFLTPGWILAQEKSSDQKPLVYQARVDSTSLNPVTAAFIENAIEQAGQQKAECLVLIVDLSDGYLDSTLNAVQALLDSPIPVIVYVAASGAKAVSAGFYLAAAGHVLALAPGTTLGPAFPADIEGLPGFRDTNREFVEQYINSTVTWAQVLERRHGRNGDEAAHLVKEHLSMPADKAVQTGVADLLADNPSDLLQKLHGRKVDFRWGTKVLNTKDVSVRELEMQPLNKTFAALAKPNFPFPLMLLGLLGTIFCLARKSCGWLGYVSLGVMTVGLCGLALLPIKYAGMVLLISGLVFYVSGVFIPKWGILAGLATAWMVIGGFSLFVSPAGFTDISPVIVVLGSILAMLMTFYASRRFAKKHSSAMHSGSGSELVNRAG